MSPQLYVPTNATQLIVPHYANPKIKHGFLKPVYGLQFGDEGKGKIIHYMLCLRKDGKKVYTFIVRYQGGGNAGHTIYDEVKRDGKKVVNKIILHTIPTGIVYEGMDCVIGDGVAFDPDDVKKELDSLEKFDALRGNLHISNRVSITWNYLKELENVSGDRKRHGTTGHAIGPTYMLQTARKGLRACDFESSKEVKDRMKEQIDYTYRMFKIKKSKHSKGWKHYKSDYYLNKEHKKTMELFDAIISMDNVDVTDTAVLVKGYLDKGRNGIGEGAQGCGLSKVRGTYPHVTSSNPGLAGLLEGIGINDSYIVPGIGVIKAYSTRVGTGPYPNLMDKQTEELVREIGGEFGATTGRPRRCGWLDLVQIYDALRTCNIDGFAVIKVDVLAGLNEIKVCTAYSKTNPKTGETTITTVMPPNMKDLGNNVSDWNAVYGYKQAGWTKDDMRKISAEYSPENVKKYFNFIKEQTGVPVKFASIGAEKKDTIELCM